MFLQLALAPQLWQAAGRSARLFMTRELLYSYKQTSPIGTLLMAVDRHGAARFIVFDPDNQPLANDYQVQENKYACGELAFQLKQYFEGHRHSFDLKLSLTGTEFQRLVWEKLRKIGFGERISYSELARRIGRKDAVRAVANAVANNPLPLIIPCHRVVPLSGGIGNYSLKSLPAEAGKKTKAWLLTLEGMEAH